MSSEGGPNKISAGREMANRARKLLEGKTLLPEDRIKLEKEAEFWEKKVSEPVERGNAFEFKIRKETENMTEEEFSSYVNQKIHDEDDKAIIILWKIKNERRILRNKK